MRVWLLILAGTVAAAGCATSPQKSSQAPVTAAEDVNTPSDTAFDELEEEFSRKQVTIADPLEPVNRVMYSVNDVVYTWVLKPVSQAYAAVVVKPVRIGIGNFFHNVGTPARLANCLLQGKGPAAGTEVQRFAINTTVGVLGFGDPARDRWGLKPAEEDLGQTLGVYGMGEGFYMVLPLLGPTTVRDSLGSLGDQFLNPVRYVEPTELSIGLSALSGINQSSLRLGEYETLKAAAVDPYVAIRTAYIQYRKTQIRDEMVPDPNRAKSQTLP